MKAKVWSYEDSEKQTVHYRGYVQIPYIYQDAHGSPRCRIDEVNCTQVRKNKLKALCDAKRLMLKLKDEKTKSY